MSRVGRRPVPLPSGVKVSLQDSTVYVEGPKGKLNRGIDSRMEVTIEDSVLHVVPREEGREARSMHGLTTTLIGNMVEGVSKGFVRDLEIIGVGYRAEVQGDSLMLNVGYSKPVSFPLPAGVSAKVEKQVNISLEAIDKELLGQTAADIRSVRPPEPYKGKGIRYKNERVRRKVGKAGAK
jgi:large subunit ribosomal protein L6